MYDEEREEEARSFDRTRRDLYYPDGLSAPPEKAPPCSPHVLKPIPGTLDLSRCTKCGAIVREKL
jgi:hypothetical protein